jgi:iron complex transport system permease protein
MVDKKPITPITDVQKEKSKYRRTLLKRTIFLVASAVVLFVVAGFSLSLGSASISFWEAYSAIFAKFWPNYFTVRPLASVIVWELRLPRMLLAVIAGAALAMPGATTQSILRNPLATPYTLGVSAGASLGAAIGIILGAGLTDGTLMIITNAFIFSLIPVTVILLLVKHKGASPETMILAGISITYVFSACTTLLQYFAESNALAATVFWTVGDLSRAAWWQLPYILVVLIACFAINLWLSWRP